MTANKIRVLAVMKDAGDFTVEWAADELEPDVDPTRVRLALVTDDRAMDLDVPTDVLQRLAERIAEL